MESIVQDVTEIETGVVAHGVNCRHVMGSGVALAIKNKWPKAYNAYMKIPEEEQQKMLGAAQIVELTELGTFFPQKLFVVNCFTQLDYGYQQGAERTKYADETAIYNSLKKTFGLAKSEDLPLYLPKIGASRGGLIWETEVKPLIEKLEKMHKIEAIICLYDEDETI